MLTDKKNYIFLILFTLFTLTGIGITDIQAQIVWENPKLPVNSFLSRQAQKGNIEIADFILPLSRKEIAYQLSALKDLSHKLTEIEKQELTFYLKEYAEFNQSVTDTSIFLKKDQHGRWRFLTVDKDGFVLRGDPVSGMETTIGQGKSILKNSSGLQFWGHINKNLSFQAYFSEITEIGNGIDTLKQFSNETGIVKTKNADINRKSLNYTNFRGSATYELGKGSLSFGSDQLQWGYGENGRLVMSDKAPSYPFIRLDYQPLKWLKFHYAHNWLHSTILDSARTYPKGNQIYGTERELYVSKFMATHSLNFFPLKGLALSIGESIIYSDKLTVGYLIPVMYFKAYDQSSSRYKINSGSNGQFFFQASSRNHIRGTHLYTTLFIDEIRMSEALNKLKSRNQIGFNFGASITDLLIPYLTMGMEYTRINPFVYQNLIPAQTYTSQNYLMGDWIGQNADRLTAWLKYNPIPRLSTKIRLDYIRKGEEGKLEDQYYAEPQPGFLSSGIEIQKQLLIQAEYELINNLNIKASYYKQGGIIRPALQPNAVSNEFRFGISYGF
ncbi:capsule assembly Wzi family protein [Daejeonella sp. H1SJ63]|uniref:capsule assembly Wzi family protein n=1 Tax=Daejeonella sp. H1SJ63 TaxID=3034145 RepID=UPI0023ECF074|nr:capsule assembly Wzi family protein [Daejeonella sp. H1SJ63]